VGGVEVVTDAVVVYGAGSYVGSSVVRELLDRGSRVIGVSRRPEFARILFPNRASGFEMASPEEVPGIVAGGTVSIVNLAYVKEAPVHLLYRENRALVDAIGKVASETRCDRIVHISTGAVFGYSFHGANPTRVRWEPTVPPPVPAIEAEPDLYPESKINTEHLIERLAGKLDCGLAILRLGNVIGPGSPIWVAGLGQRILEVKPVGYEGEPGFSNTTHVDNAAGYIAHILGQPAEELVDFGTYHHLAEFSSHRWTELLDVISEVVGYGWVTVRRPATPKGKPPVFRRLVKAAYATEVGAYARPGSGLLPHWAVDRFLGRLREPRPPVITADEKVDDPYLLEVLSTPNQFQSWTLDGWRRGLDFAAACAGIADWLRNSGYSLDAERRAAR